MTNRMEMGTLCLCKNFLSFLLKILSFTLFFGICSCAAKSNTITQGQVLRDGETLVSADGSFEFGFFSPPNSSLRYVGIWYSNVSVGPYVWVANRNAPIANKDGSFTIGYEGNLIVHDGSGNTVWSSNTTIFSNNNTAILQDSGNFEIRGNYSSPGYDFTCWQSFDHPTDTYLPGMKVPLSETIGENRLFTSWKSRNDPSNGNYSMGVDPRAAPQVVIWEGSRRRWRSGHFNGMEFIGVPSMNSFYYYGFKLSNPDSKGNMYLTYDPQSKYQKFKFIITWDGFEKSLVSSDGGNNWSMLQSEPSTKCDIYNKCGDNGYCSTNRNPVCDCFRGFKPKYQDQWENGNWSGGCVRKTQLQCERNSSLIGQDGFLQVNGAKLPDFADLLDVGDPQDCKKQCSQNCSCKAYAYANGIGCMTWVGELIDIQLFQQGGITLYIRVASSDLGSKLSGIKIAAIVLGGVIFVTILFFLWKFGAKLKVQQTNREHSDALTLGLRTSQGYSTDISGSEDISAEGNLVKAPDLPLINYNLVASATNFFAHENKLGEGGFGPVYKGVLPGGQEIAVKKLSKKSGQGMEEFKNEIRLIAKLQHRNLVRILGCCVQGEEKILVYEYMPNKSLDSFIFDSSKQGQLGWTKRLTIIEGIARGLLYLHRDARSTIIHRDLKASNILLDKDMNPKISDFGMARIFGGDQDEANTNRVVGTYGYMSPEYAMEGFFSDKSDVYSFGILLLEVVTGRRNSGFRSSEYMSLVEYAWELWSEGKAIELADPSIRNSCTSNQVSRCIHIAILCVQDSSVHRPGMAQVVLWLESDSVALPIPKQPTMTLSSYRCSREKDCQKQVSESNNNLTITLVSPR